ncbi:hypothetical protein [Cupriavidus basilensis]|uniref:hypothetical protein n=1 Tax=Cupriavidus basilensis TaxID=68895 RepID=UPI0023E89748|nr:hypothetical protein [Cupriavidus basilensis]MDF3885269.1 hypothetical protein [Cupriavidus basilensis]
MKLLDANDILLYLSTCEPLNPTSMQSKGESSAKRASKGLFWFGGSCLLAAILIVVIYKLIGWAPSWLRVALDLLLIGTLLSGLTALVIDPVMLLVRRRRWRADAKDAALRELANDHRHIANLVVHEEESLQFVKHWLTTRIGRIDTRVAQFFGKETALLSQLGLAYAILKEGGGPSWFGSTLARGLARETMSTH